MTTERITLEELEEKLSDPDVPEEDLRGYFTGDVDNSRPFQPAIMPDPKKVVVARGAWAMNKLNGLARRRRQRQFERRIESEQLPVLVSEGDSWFQFPLLRAA